MGSLAKPQGHATAALSKLPDGRPERRMQTGDRRAVASRERRSAGSRDRRLGSAPDRRLGVAVSHTA
jgi:hypothetical protein